MKTRFLLALAVLAPAIAVAAPSDSELAAIATLREGGARISLDAAGHAVELHSEGRPAMPLKSYEMIGKLPRLERLGLNGTPLTDTQWGFLRELPALRKLSVWHSGKFRTLEPFSGLPLERLTVGGCVGLRDMNKDDKAAQRNVIMTLRDVPDLLDLSLYHSPVCMEDAHLAHLVAQSPKLEILRLDFGAQPANPPSQHTPEGLAVLQKLPLKELHIENAHHFGPEHFAALADIATLEVLTVDARKKAMPMEGVEAFKAARPDVAIAVSKVGDKAPPRVKR